MTYKNIIVSWGTIIRFIILIMLICAFTNFGFCSINEPSTAMVIIGVGSITFSILLLLILIKWIFDIVEKLIKSIE